MTRSKLAQRIGLYALAFLFMLFFLAPVVWAFMISIRPTSDILSYPPKLWAPPTIEHYVNIFNTIPLLSYITNSLITVGTATLISLALGSAAAYGLARYDFRGRRDLLFWVLSLRMLPPAAVVLPFYIIFTLTGIIQNIFSLSLAYVLLTLPLSIWLMRSFFLAIPKEVEDAARLDGASDFGVLRHVSIPLAAGGMLVTTIFIFIFAWNDYIFALTLTTAQNHTVTVGISRLIAIDVIDWGMLMAGAFVAASPIIALTLVAQRHILRGLTFGFFEQRT